MFAGRTALNFIPGRGYLSPADGLLRFEFSDEGAKLTGLFNERGKRSIGQRRKGLLGDILHHPELYKHYPEVASVPFELYWMRRPGNSAFIDDSFVQLLPTVNANPQDTLASLGHQIQHVIQLIEGFSPGGCPDVIYNGLRRNYLKQTGDKYLSGDMSRTFKQQAKQAYRNLAGVKEARDVVTRLGWSMDQRNAHPPVNAKLADDETGVSFMPRETPAAPERMAVALLAKKRRQMLQSTHK